MRRRFAVGLLAFVVLALVAGPAHGRIEYKKSSIAKVSLKGGALTFPKAGAAVSPNVNWSIIASMPAGVAEPGGGAVLGRNFYVPGGYESFGPPAVLHTHMQIYSMTSGTWVDDPDIFAAGTGWADAAVCANPTTRMIHVVNGVDGANIYSAHQVFNPAAPPGTKWSFLANPNTVADGNFYSQDSGCAWIRGLMYVFGGYGLTDAGGVAQLERITWVYDPVTDTWADTGWLMNEGRIWQGYASSTGAAFAAGGVNNIMTFAATDTSERFTPAGGWTPLPDMPEARVGPGMGLLGSGAIAVWSGADLVGGIYYNSTITCGAGCASWTNVNRNLNTARAVFGWGSAVTRLFAAGGLDSAGTILSSAERTP